MKAPVHHNGLLEGARAQPQSATVGSVTAPTHQEGIRYFKGARAPVNREAGIVSARALEECGVGVNGYCAAPVHQPPRPLAAQREEVQTSKSPAPDFTMQCLSFTSLTIRQLIEKIRIPPVENGGQLRGLRDAAAALQEAAGGASADLEFSPSFWPAGLAVRLVIP